MCVGPATTLIIYCNYDGRGAKLSRVRLEPPRTITGKLRGTCSKRRENFRLIAGQIKNPGVPEEFGENAELFLESRESQVTVGRTEDACLPAPSRPVCRVPPGNQSSGNAEFGNGNSDDFSRGKLRSVSDGSRSHLLSHVVFR